MLMIVALDLAVECLLNLPPVAGQILGEESLLGLLAEVHPLVRVEAVDAVGLLGPPHLPRHQIPLPGSQVGYALGLGQAGLAPPERLLGLLALGDVRLHPEPVERLSPLVAHQRRLVPQPHPPPVFRELAVLHGEVVAALVGAFVLLQQPLPVLRVHDRDPVVGVGQALLRGVAQDGLVLGAYVGSAAGLGRLLDVNDGG